MSYLNTKPLVYAFEHGALSSEMELSFEYPAIVARKLIDDDIDVGLVPVAVLPQISMPKIISDFCIGASSPVASVCLFSQVPIEQVTHVLLDYQSRTSAALLKVLFKHHWKLNPVLHHTAAGFETQITGSTAGLVIGDRALMQRSQSVYIYDLAEAWQLFTGLPFVFAAWVANKPLPGSFTTRFNHHTGEGLKHLSEIVRRQAVAYYDLQHYYTNNIDYLLDEKKKEGLTRFLQLLTSV